MILYSRWLELPLLTRVQLAEQFGIPKTGATEVSSNIVVKDGYAIKDIEDKITLEAMQAYIEPVDGGDDFEYVFNRVIEKIMYVPPKPVISQEVITRTTVTETIVKPVSAVEEKVPGTLEVEKAKELLDTAEIIEEGGVLTEQTHAETKKSIKK